MELTPTAKPTSMRYLKEAAADLAEAEERLTSNVRNARRCGNSWEEIGKALGLSKQTAFNRYNKTAKAKNDVQQHHDITAKFLDGQVPATNREQAYAAELANLRTEISTRATELQDDSKRNTSRDHNYTPEENAEADKALAALQGASKNQMRNPRGQAVDYATNGTPWTPESAQETYIDKRPKFHLENAGFKDGVAQPGTGKGPHACKRCGSTNHKGTTDLIAAYPGECKPTKYDPRDIAKWLTSQLDAVKGF
jgi:hypothetical protein